MWKIYILCILLIFLNRIESKDRPCKKPYVSLHRACYKFVMDLKTWSEAQKLCSDEGASLVSIGSMAEKKQIVKQLHKIIRHMTHASWWVGLKLNRTISKWKWEEGSDLNLRVTQWAPGEPNNAMNGEHCAELSFRGSINDRKCQSKKPFVCELIKITQRPTSSTTATPLTTTIYTTTTSESTTTAAESSSNIVTSPETTTTQTTTEGTTSQTTTTEKIYTTTTSEQTTEIEKTSSIRTTKTYLTGYTKHGTLETVRPSITTTSILRAKSTTPTTVTNEKTTQTRPKPSTTTITTTTTTRKPIMHCPRVEAYDAIWPRADKGETVSQRCKDTGGYATWQCGGDPVQWIGEPDVSDCASDEFKDIVSLTTSISLDKKTLTADVADEITETLVAKTQKSQTMSAADVAVSTNLLETTANVKPRDSKQAKKLVQDFVAAGNNLMIQTKHSPVIKKSDKSRAASRLLSTMEAAASNMVENINEPTIYQTRTDKISLTFHVVNTTTNDNLVYDDSGTDNTLTIPSSILKSFNKDGLTKVVFMTHYDVGELLSGSGDIGSSHEYQSEVASDIISASLGNEKSVHLPEPITFTMKMTKAVQSHAVPLCSFWDFSVGTIGAWSQDGCIRYGYNATHTTCQCNHLTNFAILLDVSGVEVSYQNTRILEYITYVGCIISIISLSTAWLTFQCLSTLQGERNSIHKNLVFCLFAAELIFIVGISRTEQMVACAAVALLLHFFFLSAFTWMLMEGIHIIIMLVQVFDTAKSRMKYYYLCGYGAPVIIVGVTATINFKAYGTETHCWLTTDNWFIWSFAGPVALILIMNACVLAYSMSMVCKHSDYVFSRDRSESSNFRAWIQGALAIEVLLGLTWIFGYFFISDETVVMAYIFTILNSLQGLFIFIFHCLLNKKVRKEYKKLVHLSKKAQTSTKQSSVRKPSGSYELYVPST